MVSRGCSVCGGGGDTCNCLVVAGDNIGVTGVGSTEFPYVISAPDIPKAQKVWCGADGIPIGYSLVDKEGVQEFFLSNGSFAGVILPDGWEECKCVCQSGGGGTLYPDWQTLVINGLGELALAYDGVETVYIKNANVTAEKIDLSVPDAAARDLIASPWEGLTVYLKDLDAFQTYTGSRWRFINPYLHGTAHETGAMVLLTTASVTQLTLTVTSLGGQLLIESMAQAFNAGSGAYRSITYEVWEDGVKVDELSAGFGIAYIAAGSPYSTPQLSLKRTPAAGSHTYDIKMSASANSSVYEGYGLLKITEIS